MSNKGTAIAQLTAKKEAGEKIAVVTAYDYTMAVLADQAGMDLLLVGDSLGMVFAGYQSTMPVTMNDMLYHTQIVSRAAQRAIVVADMPYGSYHISPERAIENALLLVKKGGADAVKIECTSALLPTIKNLVDAGIPVMGHLGLLPQTAALWGGYRVQGKDEAAVMSIVDLAVDIEEAGAFSLVLECLTSEAAKVITANVDIPTIGIGAGNACDGQVLVSHDLLGYTQGHVPKFVKKYADIGAEIGRAYKEYIDDVKSGNFPGEQYAFEMDKHEARKLP
ncbi:MAG: 3-methyl-2-oxobutanoate hydroxymethyltransferase [Bacillota bacterium]|jgi:3-methyl-2-oxobutanoate hydroxymethyltransferase